MLALAKENRKVGLWEIVMFGDIIYFVGTSKMLALAKDRTETGLRNLILYRQTDVLARAKD